MQAERQVGGAKTCHATTGNVNTCTETGEWQEFEVCDEGCEVDPESQAVTCRGLA